MFFEKAKECNMRRLIIANTYYQLIFSVQMKMTLFRNDDVTILISDHSNGAEKIEKIIAGLKLFNNSYHIKTRELLRERNWFLELKHFIDMSFKNKSKYSSPLLKELSDLFFDEIVVYNVGRDSIAFFYSLSKYNKNIKLSRYEEGILSYNNTIQRIANPKRVLIDFVRMLQKKPQFTKSGENFYCFYPELYKGELSPVKVPLIDDNSETVDIIRRVFNVNLSENDYKEKYIFFTSVMDFEGEHPIGEYELVCRIAEIVGKENMLIKIHPRDRRNIYSDNGFKVDKNSSIPWEAIQLTGNFGDKVFLTATSGSVLSGSFMSSDAPETFYLYELCQVDGNTIAEESRKSIVELLNNESIKSLFSNIKVIKSLEELK